MTKRGRCVRKEHVMGYARSKTPSIGDRPGTLPFKEVKRKAILAGLRCMKAPAVIAMLVNAIFAMPSLQWGPSHEISHLELFAGECSVTRGEFQEGRTDSIALDITHDPVTMDLTTPTGFLTACYHATCLRVGAGLLAAPVCSSFVYMSSGTSQRSHAQPLGQTKYPSVAQGNLLASRTLVIILIAASLNVWWLLEQPQGSWMELHPLFQEVLRLLDVWRHRFTMGAYGSPSEKPTWIYSSEESVEELEKFRPLFQTKKDKVSLVDRYTDGSGRQRIKGNKNLKMSQSYPLPFGIALARLRSHHAARIKAQAVKTIKQNVKTYRTVPRSTRKDAMWVKHAELQSIFDFIADRKSVV